MRDERTVAVTSVRERRTCPYACMPMRACVCLCAACVHAWEAHLRQHRERQSVLTKGGEERASEREGERASVWSVSRDGGVPSEWVSQSRDRTGV